MAAASTSADLPASVTSHVSADGLEVLSVSNARGSAEIHVQGAHVTRWAPSSGEPALWLSSASLFAPGEPIRGGIPICFPWFGANAEDPSLPKHGYARRVPWTLLHAADDGEQTRLTFRLTTPDAYADSKYAALEADYTVTVGGTLTASLAVTNRGSEPVEFEAALHTYLQVGDVEQCEVVGLEDCGFIDTASTTAPADRVAPASGMPLRPRDEIDRVYVGSVAPVSVRDASSGRTVNVTKSGSLDTVVWNPGEPLAATMSDVGVGEWRTMLCVESCNVGEHAVVLAPGETHTVIASYGVEQGVS